MKILHLARQDVGGGGGGFDASYRLHCNMKAMKLDSRMVVYRKESDDPDVKSVGIHLSYSGKLRRFWYSFKIRLMQRLFKYSPYFLVDTDHEITAMQLFDVLPFVPDVIIVHLASAFIDAGVVSDLSRMTEAPVIWYCMDMAPITGGCNYAFECLGYTRQCGNCPQLGLLRGKRDLSYWQWLKKREYVQGMNITALAASSWSRKQIESASVFSNKRHELILLGVDVDVFTPVNIADARDFLSLPQGRKIIFFGAQSLFEERKGIRYLTAALGALHAMLTDNVALRNRILVVTAGRGESVAELNIPFDHMHIGFLRGDRQLAAAYQAADVFVSASLEDSGPMMINESVLCGTPVVSFEVGVALDLVHSFETGYRAKFKDKMDMAAGLRWILELNDYDVGSLRARCRSMGLKKCHPEVQVRAFEKLCNELILENK